VEIKISSPKGFRQPDASIIPEVVLTLDIDGYHAPLTSGNFIDLVDKQYYDGLMFNKIEELSVQTGLRPGQEKGYIDSQSKTLRTIPLELFYKQDSHPTYGYTSDEDQRAIETMALPFQSYGKNKMNWMQCTSCTTISL
jgi:peptidylprolyl isomerase